jgi:hypothetical protein
MMLVLIAYSLQNNFGGRPTFLVEKNHGPKNDYNI